MQEQEVQNIVNVNNNKFKPYGELIDEVYSRLNDTLIINRNPYSQIENDEIPGAEYPNDKDSEGINSLNSKQKVFNVVHKWAKEHVKCNAHNFEPIHIFLSGSGRTGKSHLVKVIYNTTSKTLFYHCKRS